jgi:hypothetical protein
MFKKLRSLIMPLYVTVLITIVTNIIPAWGRWYSGHLPYRWQTERLLHGHLSIATDTAGVQWDLAWDNGAVQQVWGLGVPLWRLPFEAIARLFGEPAFPDRIAFLIAIAGVAYLLVRFHFKFHSEINHELDPHFACFGLISTILFPPFLALCSSRFFIYEESAAYSYLAGLCLMAGTIVVSITESRRVFFCLTLASGFVTLFRPTFAAYGLASTTISILVMWIRNRQIRLALTGAACFSLGMTVVGFLNFFRFGSFSEFGYKLNINPSVPMQYLSRFGNPFQGETLIMAGKELFALLFFRYSTQGVDVYGPNLFPWQAPSFRWRELYFHTYDLTYLIMLVVVFTWLLRRAYLYKMRSKFSPLEVAALWASIGFFIEWAFYLRFPFISSRYLMDFSPSFSAISWVACWLALSGIRRCIPSNALAKLGFIVVILSWWGRQVINIRSDATHIDSSATTWVGVESQMKRDQELPPYRELPVSYTNGFPFETVGINFNGLGWNRENVAPCVILFVKDPRVLKLRVTTGESKGETSPDFKCIQARIGLERLKLISILSSSGNTEITFSGPERKRYKNGVQELSIGFVPSAQLNGGESQFKLLKVSWN